MSDWTEQLKTTLNSDMEAHFGPEIAHNLSSSKTWWPDITLQQFEALQLTKSLVKKYNDEESPSVKATAVALQKFLTVNDTCGKWSENRVDDLDDYLIGTFKKHVDRWYHLDGHGNTAISNLFSLWEDGGVGPGASVLSRSFDLYTKLFDGPLSSTSKDLLEFWRRAALQHPRWANAELTRSNRYSDKVVRGNKLSFVNKNVDTARCISTEPLINMWFQKGLESQINARTLRRYGVDLATQPRINGNLARVGSETGIYATLDLESASDSISVRMLDAMFPKGFVNWLKLTRSPECLLPSNRRLKLEMIATMGNAFCFPLQTLIFSCVINTVYELRGIPLKRPENFEFDPRGKNFGVFGDDIIVVTEAVPMVVRLLTLLGFKVNSDKSHVEGPFRESCGMDAFLGHPVRGVYIKRLRTAQDTYVAINTLNRWSARSGVPLQHTVGALLDSITTEYPRVPPDEDDTAGIHVPLTYARGVKRGVFGIYSYRKDAAIPAQYTVSGSSPFDITISEKKLPPNLQKARRVNLAGLHMAFLGGYIDGWNGHVTVRNDVVRYQTKHCITPHWDYNPCVLPNIPGVKCRPNRLLDVGGFAVWSTATTRNLNY